MTHNSTFMHPIDGSRVSTLFLGCMQLFLSWLWPLVRPSTCRLVPHIPLYRFRWHYGGYLMVLMVFCSISSPINIIYGTIYIIFDHKLWWREHLFQRPMPPISCVFIGHFLSAFRYLIWRWIMAVYMPETFQWSHWGLMAWLNPFWGWSNIVLTGLGSL